MDPKKKFFLFKKSEHFCAVPWNQFKVFTSGEVGTCVNGQETLGNIHYNSIEEILSSPNLAKIKNNLKQNLDDSNCSKCKSLEYNEDISYKFLRDLYNPMFVKSTVDYDDDMDFVLNGVDLHWGSTCNLKCITCWGRQSSAIAQELNQPIRNVTAESANKLIDFIVKNQYTLKEVYLSGGEPTLIKHNLNLLKQLRKDLDFTIRINTNMTFNSDNTIIEELKKFPKVLFTISADAMTERFNYIRRGADWLHFMNNLEQLKKLHFTWRVNSVFFVASAMQLHSTQQFFMDTWDIHDFTINQVSMDHNNLRCRNLPDTTKKIIQEQLLHHREKYKQDINLYGQLKNCLDELAQPSSESYVDFFNDVDKKAGTNWQNIFQELI